ncbi:MAG: L-threonylcarbamoyladenylate synthase [Candidatus Dojkabacteria bacterium]|nr:MAG: L-threonylcarbamoyladenylate synthase [Candidatus Dojkabacteria bacterium]
MERLTINENEYQLVVDRAVEVLASGGIVVYPTETCYGIGVDATNQAAVDRLMKYKSRREGKPLSVAVTGREMAAKYVEINDLADNLYENYLPGPITVVSKGLGQVAAGVESEYGTLGIRVPDYKLILDIVEKFGKPVTSTSANVSYKPRPYDIDTLLKNCSEQQKGYLDLILDAGVLPKNEPSTVVDTTLNSLNVMREGTLKFNEDISNDKLILQAESDSADETARFGSLVMLKHIDAMLEQPFILALKGDLGAGKTQFVKGLAQQLKINENVSSPTYTIIDEYKYEVGEHRKGLLAHMDTWRVDGAEEFARTGLEGYLKPGNVIAIEWADKFYPELLEAAKNSKAKVLKVSFEHISESKRKIEVYSEI